MSLYATLSYSPSRLDEVSDGEVQSGFVHVYIVLYDETGQLVNGNGVAVRWQITTGGVAGEVQTANVIGTHLLIYNGSMSSVINPDDPALPVTFNILGWDAPPASPPSSPLICDAQIYRVEIGGKETAPGAADGSAYVVAGTGYPLLQYSVDGQNFQSSPSFEHLSAGAYTAYVSDAQGCTATFPFTIELAQSLLTGDPSTDIGTGNVSRWSAAFNPIVFSYQRRDYDVTDIGPDGNGQAIIYANADVSTLQADDLVYLNAGAYQGTYAVSAAAGNQIVLKTAYIASNEKQGSININRLRPYYQVQTEVKYFDDTRNAFNTITAVHRPDGTGMIRADLSSFLQSLLKAQDDSDFSQINYRDTNLCACYTIRYAESWDGLPDDQKIWVSISHPYYVLYAARQLGDAGGGNMAPFVPFPSVNSTSKLARWATDFAEPAYSNGYPFDIGFIYNEALAGLNIYCELTELDINRQPITGSLQTSYLLNEDSSFLLNQDDSKLVIAGASLTNSGLVQHVGLNRLLVNQTFGAQTAYFTLTLKYNDADNQSHTITQTQTLRVDGMVDDQSVYLRWIGLTGSWNYYRFVYNQEVSLDVQNAVIIKNYVNNWATQDGIEQVISKQAGQKMKVMAEDLSVADIRGLQAIKYSPKVQMLVGRNPVKWRTIVINTATYAEYETRNGQAPFSITFNLPGINIQTQ